MTTQPRAELSDDRIWELAEPFGAFEFGDAQGDKRIAFARAVIAADRAARGGEPVARVEKATGVLKDMAIIVWLGEQPPEGTLLYAELPAPADRAARVAALVADPFADIPAEEFIRKVAKQMGPPPFDSWPVSHVCQQIADEAAEIAAAFDEKRAALAQLAGEA